jgi:hypothetical protein
MKKCVFLLATIGFVLAGCQDERGFRAKQFPPTAAQSVRPQTIQLDPNKKVVPESSEKGNDKKGLGAGAAPVTPADSPKQPEVAPAPGKQTSNDPSKMTKEAQAPSADEIFDDSALVMRDMHNKDVSDDDAKNSFRRDLTEDKAQLADQVIQGISVATQKLDESRINITVTALINDDGATPKSYVASGEVQVGDQKPEGKPLTALNPDLARNIWSTAYVCPKAKCEKPLVRLILQVGTNNGPVKVVFWQELRDGGKNTVLLSSIDPSKPWDKTNVAVKTEKKDDKDETEVKGDKGQAGIKAPEEKSKAETDKVTDKEKTEKQSAAPVATLPEQKIENAIDSPAPAPVVPASTSTLQSFKHWLRISKTIDQGSAGQQTQTQQASAAKQPKSYRTNNKSTIDSFMDWVKGKKSTTQEAQKQPTVVTPDQPKQDVKTSDTPAADGAKPAEQSAPIKDQPANKQLPEVQSI